MKPSNRSRAFVFGANADGYLHAHCKKCGSERLGELRKAGCDWAAPSFDLEINSFTMSPRDFFDPSWEETNIVLVDHERLHVAERSIKSCESCAPTEAQLPFDWLLDRVTGCDPSVTDYVLERPAQCPRCKGTLVEKTLVGLRDDGGLDGDTLTPEPHHFTIF